MQSSVDQFCSFLNIACALDQAGNSNKLCHSLCLVPETFMSKSQAGMMQHVIRIEHGHTDPVLDGFIDIALIQEEFCSSRGDFNRFLEVPGAFQKLCQLFHRYRILRRHLSSSFVNLQSLLIIPLLEECQPQAVKGFGIIWHFLQSLTICRGCLTPFLVPGSGMAFIHRLLENIFSSGHSCNYNVENFCFNPTKGLFLHSHTLAPGAHCPGVRCQGVPGEFSETFEIPFSESRWALWRQCFIFIQVACHPSSHRSALRWKGGCSMDRRSP